MNPHAAWWSLAERALDAAGDNLVERLAVYDALRALAPDEETAAHALAIASTLRGAETLELDFRKRFGRQP